MKAVSGKRICRLLEDKGWKLKRIKGSHHIYAKTGSTARIPVQGNTTLKIGLQKHMYEGCRN